MILKADLTSCWRRSDVLLITRASRSSFSAFKVSLCEHSKNAAHLAKSAPTTDFSIVSRWLILRGVANAPNDRCQSARNVDPLSAFNIGSDAISMTSGRSDNMCLEQIQLPAPVHLPLDEFKLGDLSLTQSGRSTTSKLLRSGPLPGRG